MDVPDDMDSDEELLYTVSVPGAIIAVPPFATEELEDEASLLAFGLNLRDVTRPIGQSFLQSCAEAYPLQ
jgi:hypothetical protein